ncbi:hypothetical protein VTJ83DRAFT_249 [Remersonia thermophila]|uniref:non-specific serine/threonine protein kinase n=1 Tax=Remersonia thermophila TaxID=72144 RepID=A0ABR4DKJ9_9PEZI
MSIAFFRSPAEPTVVRRTCPKYRLPLHGAFMDMSSLPGSASSNIPGATSSSRGGISRRVPNTMTKKFPSPRSFKRQPKQAMEDQSMPTLQSPSQRTCRGPGPNASQELPSSPTSEVSTFDLLHPPGGCLPGIVTAERAAAARIYLEKYFNELLAPGPLGRQVRQQLLETEMFNRARERGVPLTTAEVAEARARFYQRETEHLRALRVTRAKGLRALMGAPDAADGSDGSSNAGMRGSGSCGHSAEDYETVQVLGKGSFGVVRLVRDRTSGGRVYAMKVIRKSKMLRSNQEGHLRAERDLLVASEGSRCFQDVSNLYLVMEYMPGGDFLNYLIRENVLAEPVARFYIAEIILCVEAAHNLKCIHRDIKPDNFLVSASGHLKISDFGLAFDGHWSHDASYYSSNRTCNDNPDKKKRSNGIGACIQKHERKDLHDGELLLNWRNRCGMRRSARSVVGTSQYMAPEVIEGKRYDGRCDWWSVGVILFECIYGHTPFLSEEGRQQTKENILRHHETFYFPARPTVSRRCQHLMLSLITDKEYRLCSERYRMKDLVMASTGLTSNAGSRMQDFAGHYVFSYNAEDIKAHKWFRSIPWDRLHQLDPPLIPKLRSVDDTQYFDDGGSVSDVSESEPEMVEEGADGEGQPAMPIAQNGRATNSGRDMLFSPASCSPLAPVPGTGWSPAAYAAPNFQHPPPGPLGCDSPSSSKPANAKTNNNYQNYTPTLPVPSPGAASFLSAYPSGPDPLSYHPAGPLTPEQLAFLYPLRYPLQTLAVAVLTSTPNDNIQGKLRALDAYLEQLPDATEAERVNLREFVWRFGRACVGAGAGGEARGRRGRAPKRPRDRLLRDEGTRRVAMDVRKRTAFLGYEWTRIITEEEKNGTGKNGKDDGNENRGPERESLERDRDSDGCGGGLDEENDMGSGGHPGSRSPLRVAQQDTPGAQQKQQRCQQQ